MTRRIGDWASGERLLVLLVLMTVFVGMTAYHVIHNNLREARHAYDAQLDMSDVLQATVDQETGVRGFVATGNRTFLQPYTEGASRYLKALRALRRDVAIARIPAALPSIDRYDHMHAAWVARVQRPLIAAPAPSRSRALQVEGKRRLDIMRAMAAHATAIIASSRMQKEGRTRRAVILWIAIIVILTVVIGGWAQRNIGLRYRQEQLLRREISERLERLRTSTQELEHQRNAVIDLNQSKNDLIAVLAHDIKGPLTSIVGFAELLEEGYLEGDGATDAARTIRVNALRLAVLANDVLALSRVEHGELEIADERVDLVDVVRRTIELRAVERTIEFATMVETAFVRGDSERMFQVCDNLIANAIKYSPNGEPIAVSLEPAGEEYVLTIVDHGIGIPQADVAQLFKRFSRASNARRAKIPGTGIGLFIVKAIVERHGGTVAVTSRMDDGSTFSVRLPAFETATSARPMRVAIVSGDANVRRFAAYELRAHGYRVREAASLDELLSIGDVRPGDVILSDDGIASAHVLREAIPIPNVRLIGIGTEGSGWDDVLPRPFLTVDLIAAVSAQ